MIYLSQHESLAALETLVHTNPLIATGRYVSFRVDWADDQTEYFPAKNLSRGWNEEPPTVSSRRIGDQWLDQMRSLALAVPSLLSASELNFLLNPNHPEFRRIKIPQPAEYRFDRRLLRR